MRQKEEPGRDALPAPGLDETQEPFAAGVASPKCCKSPESRQGHGVGSP
jgi:hypothetical protein